MAGRKVGIVLKTIVFFLFVYIPLFLRIVFLHILRLKNETNRPFDLIKNTSICADCKTLHVDAAIFIW